MGSWFLKLLQVLLKLLGVVFLHKGFVETTQCSVLYKGFVETTQCSVLYKGFVETTRCSVFI